MIGGADVDDGIVKVIDIRVVLHITGGEGCQQQCIVELTLGKCGLCAKA